MGRRGWTAEEADDFISEHGTGTTPMEVWSRGRDEREDDAPTETESPGGCPEHPDATHFVGFGLAGGGYGEYKICAAEGCATVFDKTQWKDDEA